MLVKDVMSKNPKYLAPTATVKEASLEMSRLNCGFIPVGDGDRLLGAVTDRDITIRATAKGKDPNKTALQEVMTKDILYCFEEDDVTDAVHNMEENHIHRLVVLNKEKRFTGILALCDVAKKTHDTTLCGHLIESLASAAETAH